MLGDFRKSLKVLSLLKHIDTCTRHPALQAGLLSGSSFYFVFIIVVSVFAFY